MADKKISELNAAGPITGSELIDIVQGGVNVRSTVTDVANRGVKKYVATFYQTGTNDPVETVLENTLGGTPVWSRTGSGEYYITLTGAFPNSNKTIIFGPKDDITGGILFKRNDVNSIIIQSGNGDDTFTDTPIEICVYP